MECLPWEPEFALSLEGALHVASHMPPRAGGLVCGKVVLVSESPRHLGAPDSRQWLVIAGASVLGGDPRMERSLDSGQLSLPCKGLRARPCS